MSEEPIKYSFNFGALVKHIVYKITLPIYLWSIGFKTLDEYLYAAAGVEQPTKEVSDIGGTDNE